MLNISETRYWLRQVLLGDRVLGYALQVLSLLPGCAFSLKGKQICQSIIPNYLCVAHLCEDVCVCVIIIFWVPLLL